MKYIQKGERTSNSFRLEGYTEACRQLSLQTFSQP
jgi:hypothetical protein